MALVLKTIYCLAAIRHILSHIPPTASTTIMSQTQQPYCNVIAACQEPYKCIDGYCRIPCEEDSNCPNKWQCGENGFCLDGVFLDGQKKAVNQYASSLKTHLKTNRVGAEVKPAVFAFDQPVILFKAPHPLKTGLSPEEQLFRLKIGLVFIAVMCMIAGFFFAKAFSLSKVFRKVYDSSRRKLSSVITQQ
jgi:hypothetical protein